MKKKRLGLAAAAVAAILLLAGCDPGGGSQGTAASATAEGNGISAKSSKEIVAATETALRSARSVRIKFTIDDSEGKVSADLKLTRAKEAAGWIETDGLRFNFIVVHRTVYLQGRKLWEKQGGAAVAKLVGDRWVKLPRDQAPDLGPFGKELTIAKIADEVFNQEARSQMALTRKTDATLHGRPVVRLIAADGSAYVAATGKPYPLLVHATKENAGDIEFSQYDQDFGIKAPRGALTVEQLQAGYHG